jgi:hypothetical protein
LVSKVLFHPRKVDCQTPRLPTPTLRRAWCCLSNPSLLAVVQQRQTTTPSALYSTAVSHPPKPDVPRGRLVPAGKSVSERSTTVESRLEFARFLIFSVGCAKLDGGTAIIVCMDCLIHCNGAVQVIYTPSAAVSEAHGRTLSAFTIVAWRERLLMGNSPETVKQVTMKALQFARQRAEYGFASTTRQSRRNRRRIAVMRR